jgi:hypothetical protein
VPEVQNPNATMRWLLLLLLLLLFLNGKGKDNAGGDLPLYLGVPRRDVSQVVSYSSHFMNKTSEVVKSMNISARTLIKKGGISISGNSLNIELRGCHVLNFPYRDG